MTIPLHERVVPADQQTDFNKYTVYRPYIHKGSWMSVEDVCQWLQQNQRPGSAQMIESNYTLKHQDEYGKLYVYTLTLKELLSEEIVTQMQCDVYTRVIIRD